MCGITGFWQHNETIDLEQTIQGMSNTLLHRGPDDGGIWTDENVSIALGQRRLAIVDLSPEGHQPMLSANGRYVMVFNGEIYNFQEIRKDLDSLGHKFRGHSDTEVMLASFCQWGIENSVKKFVGMFAFGLWDRQDRKLYLGRDRLGEKPLYYGWLNNSFVFASELKALKPHPQWQGEINRDAITLFLRHNYIPEPYSIYQNIYKLTPGTLLTLNAPHLKTEPKPYWSVKNAVESGLNNPFRGTETEAIEALDQLLRKTISQQMIADVPLGAFLSGGIDSSTVVALMQTQSNQPVKTFSIGFEEDAYNEAQHAKAVAKHLGTDHTELYVTPTEAMAVIPKLPSLYDEPFSDSSQIPTFLVSQLARNHVTVSLSGDGGDELFGGYNRYFWGNSIWQKFGWIPSNLRKLAGNTLTSLSPQTWDQLFTQLKPILPKQLQQRLPGDKIHKLADIISVTDSQSLYQRLVSHWKNPESLVIASSEPSTALSNPQLNLANFTQQMMYLDSMTYLPGDILTKVDRAAMGVSLESRVPFLDHRVVEFAWTIPLSMKIRNNQGKWLLKQVLSQYVPQNIIDRPKMGFGVPIDCWLREDLKDWAESLLDEYRLKKEGFFDPQPIRQKWDEHLSGQRNWSYYLWDVIMFQAWLENLDMTR